MNRNAAEDNSRMHRWDIGSPTTDVPRPHIDKPEQQSSSMQNHSFNFYEDREAFRDQMRGIMGASHRIFDLLEEPPRNILQKVKSALSRWLYWVLAIVGVRLNFLRNSGTSKTHYTALLDSTVSNRKDEQFTSERLSKLVAAYVELLQQSDEMCAFRLNDLRYGCSVEYTNIAERTMNASIVRDRFANLVLSLASTFEGKSAWLGSDPKTRDLLLVAWTYYALRTSVNSLFGADELRSEFLRRRKCLQSAWTFENKGRVPPIRFLHFSGHGDSRAQFTGVLLRSQLKSSQIALRFSDLGDLEGCLVKTRFGVAIHVCRSVPIERRSWVCYHELGHLLLDHRPNSEYGLDPALIHSDALRRRFSDQEIEANGFADIWQHVADGLANYVFADNDNVVSSQEEMSELVYSEA